MNLHSAAEAWAASYEVGLRSPNMIEATLTGGSSGTADRSSWYHEECYQAGKVAAVIKRLPDHLKAVGDFLNMPDVEAFARQKRAAKSRYQRHLWAATIEVMLDGKEALSGDKVQRIRSLIDAIMDAMWVSENNGLYKFNQAETCRVMGVARQNWRRDYAKAYEVATEFMRRDISMAYQPIYDVIYELKTR